MREALCDESRGLRFRVNRNDSQVSPSAPGSTGDPPVPVGDPPTGTEWDAACLG